VGLPTPQSGAGQAVPLLKQDVGEHLAMQVSDAAFDALV
jgi:hypothetical protein